MADTGEINFHFQTVTCSFLYALIPNMISSTDYQKNAFANNILIIK